MRRSAFLLPILVILIAGVLSSIYIVDEREKGLVLRFGRVVAVKETPGLAFKIPLVDQVVRYDDRILSRDLDPIEVTPSDDRRLVVDAFARYRITDVERFRQAVGAGGLQAAAVRLDSILRAETREVLGQVSSNDILSTDRAELMLRIRNGAIEEADALGLSVIDVRLKRTDLPPANLNATFDRMISEREREAADEIARGNEAAQRTRAAADRTVVELTSDAQRQAEIIRGEADAQRNSIFARAFGADPEFFEFYRSMTAYTRALQGSNTRMVLSPDSEFFNYLRTDNPQGLDFSPTPTAAEASDTGSEEAVTPEDTAVEPEAVPEGDSAEELEAVTPEDETTQGALPDPEG